MTLVDSNVLIDIFTGDKVWFDWSEAALDRCAASGRLLINEIVFAELSARRTSEESLRANLERMSVSLERIPVSAMYLAGQAFAKYRASGGTRSSLLPDFSWARTHKHPNCRFLLAMPAGIGRIFQA
jgi:predicted nucleic acid-binding protein